METEGGMWDQEKEGEQAEEERERKVIKAHTELCQRL